MLDKNSSNQSTGWIKPAAPITRVRNQIMTELITNKRQTTRMETRVVNVRRGNDGVYRHNMAEVEVATPTIAANMSNENVMRTAEKWGSDL